MPESESQKVRRGVEQGFPRRNYEITIDPEPGVSAMDTLKLEQQMNDTSSFNAGEGIDLPSSFDIANQEAPLSRAQIASTAWQVASVNQALDPALSLKDHYLAATANIDAAGEAPVIQGAVAAYKNWYNQLTAEMVSDLINEGSTEDLVGLGNDVNEITKETDEILSGPDALEHANILAISGRVDRNVAERNYYQRKLHAITKDTGFWESAVNIAGMFLSDWRKDVSDLTGGSMLDATRDLKIMISNFQSLPQEERLRMFPSLVEDVLAAADGNELKAIARLMQFIDPSRKSEIDLESILDAVDWAFIATPMLTGIAKTIKAHNALNLAAASNNRKLAGDINAGVLSDGSNQIAEVTGVDQVTAAANTSPFKFSEHGLVEATDDINVQTAVALDEVAKVQERLRPELDSIATGKERLDEISVTPLEARIAEEKALTTARELQESYYENFGHWPEGADIVSRDTANNSFTVGYKLAGVPVNKTVIYKAGDSTPFEVLEAGQIVTKLWSPSVWMGKIADNAVDVATRIGFTQLKLANDLRKAVNSATEGLGSAFTPAGVKSRRRVDNVLLAMDSADKGKGRVFTIAEMKSAPYGLSDKEIGATMGMRDVFDTLHYMKNMQTRNSLVFKGFKEVALKGERDIVGPPRHYAARPFEEFAHVPTDITSDKSLRFWSSTGRKGIGSMVNANFINLKKKYDEGYKLVRFQEKQRFGDELTDFALIKQERLSDLRMNVINKKTAYVPKISTDGFYFVKQSMGAMVNGRAIKAGQAGASLRTVRMFDNKRDAESYAEGLRASSVDPITGKGLDPGKVKYDVKHDRELTPSQRENEIVNEAGGTFSSARATHEITYGLDGDVPRRLSAFDSMQRNLSHVANNIPINNFRLGIQERWLKSAVDSEGRPLIQTPGDFNSPIIAEVGSRAEVALRESRNWIKDQMRIPTDGELRWEMATRRMAEWMEGKPILDTKIPFKPNASFRRGIQVAGQSDPFSVMRGSAFHLMLGWFNPAQLWVQAQGASIAFALSPQSAPKLMRQYMALRAGMHYKGQGADLALRKTAKAAGIPEDEMIELVEMFNKSGLMQSVKSTADFNAAAQGYWHGASAIRAAAEKGLFFFREGETFVRGYSFLLARQKWRKANPGKKMGDDDLKDIITSTTRKMMNLNRANRAHWQKGIWSIPTQFQQVSAKFVENMLPNILPGAAKNFTGWEKGRILLGQTALYGTAGVPLGNWIAEEIAHMQGKEPGETGEAVAQGIKGGFWQWLSQETVGTSFNFGKRGAFADGVTNLIESLVRDDIPIHSFLGPFKTVPDRALKSMEVIAPMVLSFDDLELTQTEVLTAISSVAELTSFWNAMHRSWTWYKAGDITIGNNKLFDIDTDDLLGKDMFMLYGKALGFSPTRISDHFDAKGFVKNHKEFKKQKLETLKKMMVQYYGTGKFDDADLRNFRAKEFVILQGANEQEQKEIQRSFATWLMTSKSQEAEFILKALKTHMESGDTNIGGKGILYNSNLAGKVEE